MNRSHPASDVYALGGLLYELLAERSPHHFSSSHPSSEEIARVICEEEAIAPSLVARSVSTGRALRGDLDKIALLALRKEPRQRYASAGAFAEDIHRHLEGRPVHARRHTAAYVTRRFLRRHKFAASLASAAIAVGLVAGAISLHKTRETAERSSILEKEAASLLAHVQTAWRMGKPGEALAGSERAVGLLRELALLRPGDASSLEREAYAHQCAAIA